MRATITCLVFCTISCQQGAEGTIEGRSQAQSITASPNVIVSRQNQDNSETAVAVFPIAAGESPTAIVIGYNWTAGRQATPKTGLSWAVSTDHGANWTAHTPTLNDFPAPTDEMGNVLKMSDGSDYNGMAGDPGLAQTSHANQVVFVGVAASKGNTQGNTDVVLALSIDQAGQFPRAFLVSTPLSGQRVDQPSVSYNPATGKIWTGWLQLMPGSPNGQMWVRSLSVSATGAISADAPARLTPPAGTDPTTVQAVVVYSTNLAAGSGIWAAYTDGFVPGEGWCASGPCGMGGCMNDGGVTRHWYLSYAQAVSSSDIMPSAWAGARVATDANWRHCLTDGQAGRLNKPRPGFVVDIQSEHCVLAVPIHDDDGTHIHAMTFDGAFQGITDVPMPHDGWEDQFGMALAYDGASQLALTWHDTYGDPTDHLIVMRASMSVDHGVSWLGPPGMASANSISAPMNIMGEQYPWSMFNVNGNNVWGDFEGLAADPMHV